MTSTVRPTVLLVPESFIPYPCLFVRPNSNCILFSFLGQNHMVSYLLDHIMALTLLDSDRTSTRSITPQRIWILGQIGSDRPI